MKKKLEAFQQKIGYHFQDPHYLEQALTHSSYANEYRMGKSGSNERLEFLGDAVLELVSSEFFFYRYRDKSEGELTKLRARFVCEPALAYCAEAIGLGEVLLLGKGEEATGGRLRPSLISDAFEALIGAVYLDGGFANAKEIVLNFILNDIESKVFFYDSKTILQEAIQREGRNQPEYRLLSESGPDHSKMFSVSVHLEDRELGRGRANSKKQAEQLAAHEALKRLGIVKAEEKSS
ncbi:MAG: ribonuclease III [Johnsonella sp.]|nr:ribonuclease III [Johnsonella sp.]